MTLLVFGGAIFAVICVVAVVLLSEPKNHDD